MVETIRQACGDTFADGADAAGDGGGEGADKTVINRINAPDVSADFAFAEDAELLEIIFPQILDCDAAFRAAAARRCSLTARHLDRRGAS